MKSLWRKNENKNKALLDYRATPIPGISLSPSQLCMDRRLRTTLPMATGLLKPETYNAQEIKRSLQKAKDKQKYHYDRHGTRELEFFFFFKASGGKAVTDSQGYISGISVAK